MFSLCFVFFLFFFFFCFLFPVLPKVVFGLFYERGEFLGVFLVQRCLFAEKLAGCQNPLPAFSDAVVHLVETIEKIHTIRHLHTLLADTNQKREKRDQREKGGEGKKEDEDEKKKTRRKKN